MPLKISVSGIRGVVGDGLDTTLIVKLSAALGIYSLKHGKRVVVGRDTRNTGDMVNRIVCGTLMSVGCDVVDIGIASTPTTQLAVEYFHAGGGIIITASHNPIQWNALKLLRHDGIFLYQPELDEVMKISEAVSYVKYDKVGSYTFHEGFFNFHKNMVFDHIATEAIRAKKFRVVFDPVNGAGFKDTADFLENLGCEIVGINTENQGYFNHNPEPIRENLADLVKVVIENNADIGFAQDADADRLAIVSEKGEFIGEDYTQVLAADYYLKKNKGDIATNLSSSRLMDDAAKKYGVKCFRSKVGEVNVVEKLKEKKCIIGGEGNGGVIFPAMHYGRDSFIGMGLILSLLAVEKRTVSEIVSDYPHYTMVKKKFDLKEVKNPDIKGLLDACQKKAEEVSNSCGCGEIISVNTEDGLKIDFEKSWVHIRTSNTEPVMRIITEAESVENAENLNIKCWEVLKTL